MTTNKQKQARPPKLLRGLFSLVAIIVISILLSGWAIIHYQVEQLVAQRTSEYAHSIAQIAANSAAEALLSDDKIQLKNLVENVAQDPYIRSATIFAEDGQVVAHFPENMLVQESDPLLGSPDAQQLTKQATSAQAANGVASPPNSQKENINNPDTSTTDETAEEEQELASGVEESPETTDNTATELKSAAQAYIRSQSDIPFIEKITYQDVTAGWFKISLNRHLLESSFRKSLYDSHKYIIGIAILLLALLFFVLFKFDKKVKKLVANCHRLIQANAPQLPRNNEQWFDYFQEMSDTQCLALSDNPQLTFSQLLQWNNSRSVESSVFCYCQFSMQDQDHEDAASNLSLAEKYLKAAVQSHGVQSQGEILSGCLIPFLANNNEDQANSELHNAELLQQAVSLVFLINELLASLDLQIKLRAFIGKSNLLVLENDRAAITGISLSNKMMEKIHQLAPHIRYGDTVFIGLANESLNHVGDIEPLSAERSLEQTPPLRLIKINEAICLQASRQISYITTNIS